MINEDDRSHNIRKTNTLAKEIGECQNGDTVNHPISQKSSQAPPFTSTEKGGWGHEMH